MSDTLETGKNQDPKPGYGRPPVSTRFRPGQSGNPSGRPISIINFINRELKKKVKIDGTGETIKKAEAVAKRLVQMAYNGDVTAIKELIDRTEGKAAQRIELDANIQSTETKINIDIRAQIQLDPEAKAALESFNNRIIGHLK